MRCSCCNRNLSDYESVLKHPVTGDYLDTCNKCLAQIPEITPIEPDYIEDDTGYEDEEFFVEEETDE